MSKRQNYFLLAGLFFVGFLLLEFTTIYGDPGWFKAFVLIAGITFLISALASQQKPDGADGGNT
jgi:hypothetical protein